MSDIRQYLETRVSMGEKEWLRREPKTTHPEILALVRKFEEAGGIYNEEAEEMIEARVGDLPNHRYHGHPERHPLTDQLGHEVYLARAILKDERNKARESELLAQGFVPANSFNQKDGAHYLFCAGTRYVGQDVPQYGEVVKVRAKRMADGSFAFLPGRNRTRYLAASGHVLIKSA